MTLLAVREGPTPTGPVLFATTREHIHNYETYFAGRCYQVEGPVERPLTLETQDDVDTVLHDLGILGAVNLFMQADNFASAYFLAESTVADWARKRGYDAVVCQEGDLLPCLTDGPPETMLLYPDRYRLELADRWPSDQ